MKKPKPKKPGTIQQRVRARRKKHKNQPFAKKSVRALKRTTIDVRDDYRHAPPSARAIQALRFFLGLSCSSFARQISSPDNTVTSYAVRQWEIGRRVPREENTDRIEELARINGVDLFRTDENDYNKPRLQVQVFVDREDVKLKRSAS